MQLASHSQNVSDQHRKKKLQAILYNTNIILLVIMLLAWNPAHSQEQELSGYRGGAENLYVKLSI